MIKPPYTLQDLANGFDLTLRTARYYVENVLPEHHRSGRGRTAEYGQDTWNCFAFIKKARDKDLSLAQISSVLADLGQPEIDRVAEGLEELTILPVASSTVSRKEQAFRAVQRMSERMEKHTRKYADDTVHSVSYSLRPPSGPPPKSLYEVASLESTRPDHVGSTEQRWRIIYQDEDLQITYRGQADPEQREQVRLAAELMRKILRRK
jgi:DNA-binding transcriptional MerR regulator